MVWLSFPDLLVRAQSPHGLGQSAFWAWVVALWLSVGPVVLALAVAQDWHRGYRARREIIAACAVVAIATMAQWEVSEAWEIIARPIVLAVMLWILRPFDPPVPSA
jgi:hypothetical protein